MGSHRPGVTNFVHVGLVVEDLDETVGFLELLGFDCGAPRGVQRRVDRSVVEIVDSENMFLLCYVRGPEVLIAELAERLDRSGRHGQNVSVAAGGRVGSPG